MIQRIQSVYLLLGAAIQVTFALGTYFTYKVAEVTYTITGSGTFNSEGEKVGGNMKTLVLGIGIALLSFVTIFLFKNRKQQMKFARISALLTIAEIVFLVIAFFNVKELSEDSINFGVSTFILPISTILFLFAAKAIKKDEDLVKSVDRIR